MRMYSSLLAVALLAAPVGAVAQQAGAPAAPAVNPIERLLQRRTELGLTQEQVQKLETIRQRSAARERELVAKMTEARGAAPGVPVRMQAATPAERQALRERVRPFADELHQLHQHQIQEARGILTAQQNANAWRGMGPQGGMGPGMGRGMMQHRPGMRGGRGPGRGR